MFKKMRLVIVFGMFLNPSFKMTSSFSHRRGIAAYLYSQLRKLLLTSRNTNYPRKNPTYLKQVYTFQSNQIKSSQIKENLSYLANSYFYNYKGKEKKIDKGNGVILLDRKLYDNALQEIISDTSKFEKLNEDPTLKREASLLRFLRKLKQKKRF